MHNEIYAFAIFILNGFLIGLLFDVFRILRKSFKTSDIITNIQDLIFGIITGIIILSSILLVVIITMIILLSVLMPKSLSKQIDKLGDLNEVKISLYSFTTDETYDLDFAEKKVHDEVLSKLNSMKYKLYPKYKLVEKRIGEYTIILEGDIVIYLNQGYMIINGENRTVKSYSPDELYTIIQILISSESIEIIDEKFNESL